MKYNEFIANLEKNKIYPFYLFEGQEDYSKTEAVHHLKTRLAPGNEDFNFQRMSATSHRARDIVESAYQLSFSSTWRLVVVEEADKFNSEEDIQVLLNYLKNPVHSACIVFMANQFNKKTRLYHLFREKGTVVSFSALRGFEVVNWIKKEIEKESKTITSDAAAELLKRRGGDLVLLHNEIDKLVSFVHPDTSIEKSHIVALYPEAITEDIFDFLKALRKKDLSVTLSTLNKLFAKGEEPLVIIAMLAREVRILFSLKLAGPDLTVKQACPYVFKGKFSYAPYYLEKVQDYLEAARKLTIDQLHCIQQTILAAEFSIKRGEESPELAIQKTVLRLLRS